MNSRSGDPFSGQPHRRERSPLLPGGGGGYSSMNAEQLRSACPPPRLCRRGGTETFPESTPSPEERDNHITSTSASYRTISFNNNKEKQTHHPATRLLQSALNAVTRASAKNSLHSRLRPRAAECHYRWHPAPILLQRRETAARATLNVDCNEDPLSAWMLPPSKLWSDFLPVPSALHVDGTARYSGRVRTRLPAHRGRSLPMLDENDPSHYRPARQLCRLTCCVSPICL